MMKQRKILGTQLVMAIIAIVIGLKMKIERAEYASVVVLLGFAALMILYFVRFLDKKIKRPLDYIRLITIMLCGINGLALGWKFLRESAFEYYALWALKGMLVVWLLAEVFYLFRKKS
ncbi:MAG: hypothetical protein ACPGJS_15975 [Flammeovirgaceae bacterium]